MIDQLGGDLLQPDKATNDDYEDELKVFFCSRTHSQLSQFVGELRRVRMPPLVPFEDETGNSKDDEVTEHIKHLSLGSRKNLCVNDEVSKLGSVTTINERCLELQKPSNPKDVKCKYLPSKEKEALLNEFRDHALAKIRDIEDMGQLGKRIGVCPYYASRGAILPSEVSFVNVSSFLDHSEFMMLTQ